MEIVYTVNNMQVKCQVCNKEFTTYPSRIKKGAGKFCSRECFISTYTNKVECTCKNCGKTYSVAKSQKGKDYCSKECMEEHFYKTGKWEGKVKVLCQNCGREVKRYGGGKFCSHKCYWESMKLPEDELKKRQLKRLHYYRFGGNREKCLERDNHTCTACGSTENLVVHHIDGTGYKSVGFKNMNNDLDNLQTLCESCHNSLHKSS